MSAGTLPAGHAEITARASVLAYPAPAFAFAHPYGGGVRAVPWWGVVSSAGAPVLLIGGWTAAASLQPGSFDPVSQTISALAADGAADRCLMTLALLGVGTCYLVTAVALRTAAAAGRLILAAGGVAVILVAANPEPVNGGSLAHTFWATTGFLALALWPVAGRGTGPQVPLALRPAVCAGATAGLTCLVVWFGAELILGGGQLGLAERVLAGSQSLWPLVVVLTAAARRAPLAGHRDASVPR